MNVTAALATLLKLRRAALDEVQGAMAAAYAAERDACARVEDAERDMEREADAARSLLAGDETVEAYARWLPVGLRAIEQAREAQNAANAELDRVRAMLTLCRTEVQAVETQIEGVSRAESRERGRRDQLAADEAARLVFMRRSGEP